jgi:hypothetical protein
MKNDDVALSLLRIFPEIVKDEKERKKKKKKIWREEEEEEQVSRRTLIDNLSLDCQPTTTPLVNNQL